MKNNCIILFVKSPRPGFVKTRLAETIGKEKACFLYEKFVKKIIKEISSADAEFEIHYFPEHDLDFIKNRFGSDFKYFPQKGENLGEKMKNSILNALKKGYSKVVLTGSDVPDIDSETFVHAFENIDSNPVIGPCHDGGYYLIGFDNESFFPQIFDNIDWSTELVLSQTLNKIKTDKKAVLLRKLNDIDTYKDLENSKFYESLK